MSEQDNGSPANKANLVLLMSGLWDVDNPEAWKDIIWRRFRKRLVYCEDPKADKGATNVLGIAFPSIFIQFDGFFFHITTIPEPFFTDRESLAEQLGELRLRRAVLDHEAHISVNLLNYPEDTDEDEAARMIGKMTSAIGWSPATLAVVCPLIEHVRVWDKNVRKALRTEHPVTALTQTPPSKVPVVPGDANDADLKAATEEARRRWPEFAQAFAVKKTEQIFAVKSPFKDGELTEFMWIKVLKIEDEFLQGVIDNDPVEVKKFKRGTRVRLRAKALTDWMYTDGDDIIGGFTNKALDKAAQARLDKLRDEIESEEEDLEDDEDEDLADEVEEEPQRPARAPATPKRSQAKAPAKSSSSMGLLWLIVGGVAALLLLCGGVGVGLTVWLMRGKEPAPPQAQQIPQPPPVNRLRPQGGNSGEHIAREFAEALGRKDWHAAYACTTPAFQARQSEQQFQNAVMASRVLEGRLPFELDGAGLATPQEVRFNLRNKGAGLRHPPAAVLATINDSGWWVDSTEWNGPAPIETPKGPPAPIQTPIAPPPPAPVAPPKPVVPPKPPSPPEPKRLRERGGNSDEHIVRDFARALSNKDLDAAYACTTPEFQKEQSLEQFKKAVAQSKVLQGKMPLQPQFDRVLEGQEKRWLLRHKDVPFGGPSAVILQVKPDSLGWWVTRIEWKGK
jgi:uncharacterized protein YegJ (DUF2314 family)